MNDDMRPKEILDALHFLNKARNDLWKSDPLHAVYTRQIERLLEVQAMMASQAVIEYEVPN